MAVIIRPVDSAAELVNAFDVAGAQFDPAIDHTDQRRFADLEAAYLDERELLLVAEEGSAVAGAAMGFRSSGSEVTLRILAVADGHRRQGLGRALLRAFEASALRLGATRISLGADAEAGFYVRHGYHTMLLLQWAYDPSRFDAEMEALAAGPVKEMAWHRDSFDGVPQLFVDLDQPSPVVREPGPGPSRRGARWLLHDQSDQRTEQVGITRKQRPPRPLAATRFRVRRPFQERFETHQIDGRHRGAPGPG